MSIYISGPMTGYPDFNRPTFNVAARLLFKWTDGDAIANPAAADLGPTATWADYMRVHLVTIATEVDRVVTLPGWDKSRGAQLEVHVARELGIRVDEWADVIPCDHCGHTRAVHDPHEGYCNRYDCGEDAGGAPCSGYQAVQS